MHANIYLSELYVTCKTNMTRLVFPILLLVSTYALSQNPFDILAKEKRVDIPFKLENNFIVVELTMNGRLPLRFIFDTGAEHTILSKQELAPLLGLRVEKEFTIMGADLKTELTAFLARRVNFSIGAMTAKRQDILILKEDYLNFDEYTGKVIHGILGANLFKHVVIQINYRRQVISFFHHAHFQAPKKSIEIPAKFKKNKPYLIAELEILKDSVIKTDLLVDTGASLGLLFHVNGQDDKTLKFPPNTITGNIGQGLGGSIEGIIGRIHQLKLKSFQFNNMHANFQDLSHVSDTSFLNGRDGILGNKLLQRFTLTINYPFQKLYLTPYKKYNKGFKYDRSGLVLISTGNTLNNIVIQYVIDGSPAHKVGLQPEDYIISFNGISTQFRGLASLVRKLQSKKNKLIRLKIKRNGKKFKVKFRLQDLI